MPPTPGKPMDKPTRWTPAKRQAFADGYDAGLGMLTSWRACPFTYGTACWHCWLFGWRAGRYTSWRERKG